MKKILIGLSAIVFIAACNNEKTESTEGEKKMEAATSTPADLPYKATYSSNFNQDVSDADLKTVLMSYKHWETGDMASLSRDMGDSVEVDFNDGDRFHGTNAELMKRWSTYRDSLSSVSIEMEVWHKMYEPEKKDGVVVTWYKETDTYKTGKVDSAMYQDVNLVKNGKIVYYRQYKRPLK
jgi:ketosteroid isomerase-like protein